MKNSLNPSRFPSVRQMIVESALRELVEEESPSWGVSYRRAYDDTAIVDGAFEVDGDNVLLDYHGSEKNVVIPECVVAIDGAFRNDVNLVSVVLPNGVKSISEDSFEGCVNLRTIFVSNREQEDMLEKSKWLSPNVNIERI